MIALAMQKIVKCCVVCVVAAALGAVGRSLVKTQQDNEQLLKLRPDVQRNTATRAQTASSPPSPPPAPPTLLGCSGRGSGQCPEWTYRRDGAQRDECWRANVSAQARTKMGAIVFLARRADVNDLIKTIPLLFEQFTRAFPHPIVIFHEDFEAVHKDRVRKASPESMIRFEQISFCLPVHLAERKAHVPKFICDIKCRDVSYRHMIRFFFIKIFQHPAMAHFKYYWRLDTHSEISTKVDFDVFELMQKQNKKYGFAMLNVDPPKLVKYMDVWSANFMKTNKLTIADPKWFEEMVTTRQYAGRSLHFWNNFELVDLQWITSSDVLRYSRHMDTVGGIYSYRWGDAPLRTCALCVAPRLACMCFPCECGELLKTSLTKCKKSHRRYEAGLFLKRSDVMNFGTLIGYR